MHWDDEDISSMATITAECPCCHSVFYVDTDYPQKWLAQHAPGAKPGETVHYLCTEHRFLPRVPGLPFLQQVPGGSIAHGPLVSNT